MVAAGLGDIAVPGLLIALSLRFDAHLRQDGMGQEAGIASFPTAKPYFWTAMVHPAFFVFGALQLLICTDLVP